MSEPILVKGILWFGQRAAVVCDGNCAKAWGINQRPRVELSDNPDDYAYLADGELGEAPRQPGTWEGEDTKPQNYTDPRRQNKWCCRECERSEVETQGLVRLKDFSKRVFNLHSRQETIAS